MRFQNVQLTGLFAVGDQILAEIAEGPRLADGKFGGPPTMNHPVTFQVNGTFAPAPPDR